MPDARAAALREVTNMNDDLRKAIGRQLAEAVSTLAEIRDAVEESEATTSTLARVLVQIEDATEALAVVAERLAPFEAVPESGR
jgi:hypothetical protein